MNGDDHPRDVLWQNPTTLVIIYNK